MKTNNYPEKLAEIKCFIENMDENAHYTTWQSCNFKISSSLQVYRLIDSVTKPAR